MSSPLTEGRLLGQSKGGSEVTPFLCLPGTSVLFLNKRQGSRKWAGSFTVGLLESHTLNLCTCERKNRGMCVSFNGSCGPCIHSPPPFNRDLAALGAMTHWPSKKHSSTHPEVIPAKSSSSSPHNSSLFFGRQLKEQRVFSLLHCKMSQLILSLTYLSQFIDSGSKVLRSF